jgi:hypothetical protein
MRAQHVREVVAAGALNGTSERPCNSRSLHAPRMLGRSALVGRVGWILGFLAGRVDDLGRTLLDRLRCLLGGSALEQLEMRSVLSWISVILRNIHFGGGLSGILVNLVSQSTLSSFGARSFRITPIPMNAATAMINFFISP